ncbi:MAG TPA: hypothetical protein VFT83_02680 [Nitrososphaeraceae archaeon]|nr:hypothetical protein [Nitrososphaeraceae archaeon]
MTRRIEPITYMIRAGSEGSSRFRNNTIIPTIIRAIPLSKETI